MDLFVLSTLSCILDNTAPFLIRFISSFARKKIYDVELRKQLSDLKHDMMGLSMVDEFAKCAKLQRQCNRIQSILEENTNRRLNRTMKLHMLFVYTFRAFNGALISWLCYMYKDEPVIILSENMLWPIHNFFSWPCQHENAISLLMWLVITRLGISVCKKLISPLYC